MTPAQTAPLKLMGVLAHPDDESLGIGGTLAKYAGEGIETYLVTATRGERGRFGESGEKPPPDVVGRVREAELREAAGDHSRKPPLQTFQERLLDLLTSPVCGETSTDQN